LPGLFEIIGIREVEYHRGDAGLSRFDGPAVRTPFFGFYGDHGKPIERSSLKVILGHHLSIVLSYGLFGPRDVTQRVPWKIDVEQFQLLELDDLVQGILNEGL